MKKKCFAVLFIVALLTGIFAGCGEENGPETIPSETTEGSTAETTAPTTQLPTEEITEPTTVAPTEETTQETLPSETVDMNAVPEEPIDILYCRYTEWPYFAMVGTCSEGATVEAKIGEETYSSKSYKGWFSLRLPSENGSATVTMSQTLNGVIYDEAFEYTAWPQHPGEGRWPMITGKDFQFFLQKMLPDFQHENLDDQAVYDSFRDRLEERLETVHGYNPDAEIIYLIVPSSMSMYPELVPEEYKEGTGLSRLDKVIEAIREAGATAIDVEEAFRAHKYDEMPLYYKLDSHWSDYGAYVAYEALFDYISQSYPQAAPRGAEEFNWNPGYYQSGDLTYYLGMPQSSVMEYAYYRTFDFDAPYSITSIPRYRYENMLFYSDNVTWDHTIRTDRPELPSCMVIRDSYSTQMYDLIAERMDTTHYRGMWNYTWDSAAIKNEEPDYIIYLVAEWNIDSILK